MLYCILKHQTRLAGWHLELILASGSNTVVVHSSHHPKVESFQAPEERQWEINLWLNQHFEQEYLDFSNRALMTGAK